MGTVYTTTLQSSNEDSYLAELARIYEAMRKRIASWHGNSKWKVDLVLLSDPSSSTPPSTLKSRDHKEDICAANTSRTQTTSTSSVASGSPSSGCSEKICQLNERITELERQLKEERERRDNELRPPSVRCQLEELKLCHQVEQRLLQEEVMVLSEKLKSAYRKLSACSTSLNETGSDGSAYNGGEHHSSPENRFTGFADLILLADQALKAEKLSRSEIAADVCLDGMRTPERTPTSNVRGGSPSSCHRMGRMSRILPRPTGSSGPVSINGAGVASTAVLFPAQPLPPKQCLAPDSSGPMAGSAQRAFISPTKCSHRSSMPPIAPRIAEPGLNYEIRGSLISEATGNVAQSHAFLPVSPMPLRKKARSPYVKWTPAEDTKLREAVTKYGSRNWDAVSREVPGRNYHQCRQRWIKVLSQVSAPESATQAKKGEHKADLQLMLSPKLSATEMSSDHDENEATTASGDAVKEAGTPLSNKRIKVKECGADGDEICPWARTPHQNHGAARPRDICSA